MSESIQRSLSPTSRWLARYVFVSGMLKLSFDTGHELTTALLPLFLQSFGDKRVLVDEQWPELSLIDSAGSIHPPQRMTNRKLAV